MIRLPLVLIFSAFLFSTGIYGVLARRNAVMVLMAIVTTFATGPLLSLADRWRAQPLADRHGEGIVVQGNQRS